MEPLISEERLPSGTATWEDSGQNRTGKASPWVLIIEQSVWKMMNWFKIIEEGTGFASWHG